MKVEFIEEELRELINVMERDVTWASISEGEHPSTVKLHDALLSALESIAGYPSHVMLITTLNPAPVKADIPLYKVHHSKVNFYMGGKRNEPGYYLTNGVHWILRRHKTRKEAEAAKARLNEKIEQARLL